MTYIKEKSSLIATIICGLLLIIGFINQNTDGIIYPYLFIIGMIIGGFHQTKDGIIDTIKDRHLNVDLLMALAAVGACTIEYYFEGIMLTFIFSLSGSLEEFTTNKSKKEIESLMEIQPENAFLLNENGQTSEVPVENLKIGDTLLVPKGASIPIDGELLTIHATIDEAAITGESIPREKKMNENLYAGTINIGNSLKMTVTKESKDTLFSKIIQLVDEAQNTPSKTASFLSNFENIYVKVVLLVVPLAILIPYFLIGWSWSESFYRGMVLLVVASPCALVASATPATLAAISHGAKNGVLFKGGIYLEALADLKAITFDKTGTITKGSPVVTDEIFMIENRQDIIDALVAIETESTHPLANAITTKYIPLVSNKYALEVNDITGSGMLGLDNNNEWKVGNVDFVTSLPLSEEIIKKTEQLQNEGKTVIYFSKNNQVIAFFGLLDVPKTEAIETIKYFRDNNIQTTMLTGDHSQTANAVAKMIGIDAVIADCLPEDKTIFIKEQKEKFGINAMIGDGVNDAPALANASIGIAMGQGTDIAIDVADIVLMKDDLSKLAVSHQLSLKLKKIVKQNIIFSLSVIAILIFSNFFKVINLPLGVIGHEGSTILVILNGLRMLQKLPIEKKIEKTEESYRPSKQLNKQIN
ncbi:MULTISPECIES: heavy metal translocating P-type ATPase [Vagococcus]|uniref:Lead, cadmium, zinc and mercury transporting ATPase Copper-translocating P-type ATPase n=1 Tax=Vagococcus fluvialis bH819 TaxID=1255619 RepID=A0A1X6WR43_9ENTE|nr:MULTISPECIES: heavy metal translocating P-type ATPase [Vagococcus]SLM86702.1 Lead, cadmium, zinc and mercury transporting ATPase; Copper-translocating P-type ATPase [Vagococcus fluvialis bH819]HCM90910.1 heavy metal translocating P-type ATPase [Vagococcus sp.]